MTPQEPVATDPGAAFDQAIADARKTAEAAAPETPDDEDPHPEAAADEDPADTPPAEDVPPPEDDVAALKARLQQFERDLAQERSAKLAALNRLQPTQRRLSDLERQLAEAKPTTPPPPAPSPAPAAASQFETPEWKAYERDFPSEASATRKAVEAALLESTKRVQSAEQKLALFEQQFGKKLEQVDGFVQRETSSRELAAFENAHPDWQEWVTPKSAEDAVFLGYRKDGTPVHAARLFAEWLQSQPPEIQGWYGSDYAAQNIALMDNFKRDVKLAEWHEAQQAQQQQATETPPDAEAARRAHARREQARSAGVAPDLRGQPAVARTAPPTSDPELFDYLIRQQQRR